MTNFILQNAVTGRQQTPWMFTAWNFKEFLD